MYWNVLEYTLLPLKLIVLFQFQYNVLLHFCLVDQKWLLDRTIVLWKTKSYLQLFTPIIFKGTAGVGDTSSYFRGEFGAELWPCLIHRGRAGAGVDTRSCFKGCLLMCLPFSWDRGSGWYSYLLQECWEWYCCKGKKNGTRTECRM